MIVLAIDRPRPVPPFARESELSAWAKRWKMRG